MIRWLLCLLMGHDWRWAGCGLPDSAWPEDYWECAKCQQDSRPAWAIEDDLLCREERIQLLSRPAHERGQR